MTQKILIYTYYSIAIVQSPYDLPYTNTDPLLPLVSALSTSSVSCSMSPSSAREQSMMKDVGATVSTIPNMNWPGPLGCLASRKLRKESW